ncbi:hypothetical protein [Nocardiopsis ansamitocini]|uniref:Uncharacterized protein n=1 Tax=Nocardiopsis ansamitocini TaxID=1670832 RepID=A0A9W6P2B2_9ACTN|nr:hypothetical protein [Nocardiopsis ansamitocini]GLU45834.1 hypothetical protein Nans01_01850 [Nocardiopsis ansamitocini]
MNPFGDAESRTRDKGRTDADTTAVHAVPATGTDNGADSTRPTTERDARVVDSNGAGRSDSDASTPAAPGTGDVSAAGRTGADRERDATSTSTGDNGTASSAASRTGRTGADHTGTDHAATSGTGSASDNGESDPLRVRWREIQGEFVDDPKASVAAADALVGKTLEQITAKLTERKRKVESSWQEGGDGDTEHLRLALQEYRSLLDHLITAATVK